MSRSLGGAFGVDVVGIVGLGKVGGTVSRAFEEAGQATRSYDRYLGVGTPQELSGCPVVFLCVPTPAVDHAGLDQTEVWSAVEEIEPHLDTGSIIAVKSTVLPGTNERLAESFDRLEFASVPEFLVAARPLETFSTPDRVIVGARSGRVATILASLMARVAPASPMLLLTPTEAELVKLCSNAMLAARVILANELSEICERFGVDWPRIQAGVGLDRRIGPEHLRVTPEGGFGGGCLPKDLDGLIAASSAAGYDPTVLRSIVAFNRSIRSSSATTLAGDGAEAEVVASDPGWGD